MENFVVMSQWEALALLLIGISINQLKSMPEGTTTLDLPITTAAYVCTLIFVSYSGHLDNDSICELHGCTEQPSSFSSCLSKIFIDLFFAGINDFGFLNAGNSSFYGLCLQWICPQKPIWHEHISSGGLT